MRNLRLLDSYRRRGRDVIELWGWEGDETCGAFSLKSSIDGGELTVIASCGAGWDHVSVSRRNRCPNWTEMEQVKRAFFLDDETAMQLHVPPADHQTPHPYTLHIWRPQNQEIPRPPVAMVGIGKEPLRSREEAMAMRKRIRGETRSD